MRTLLLFIPIGVLGLIRWSSWLVRRVPAVLYRPYPEGHSEPITVVTPVYQEDPDVFRAAVESWLANRGVQEVIAVVDVTDTRCIAIANELAQTKRVAVIVTDVPGKRDALRRGWEAAKTEIIALVDSDTVWADDVATRVTEPFADPEVGGVGTRQNVLNPESLWQRLNDFYLDSRYLDEVAGQTQWGQAVSCLSGRTAVYRRALLLEVSEAFMTETFMGVPCNSGEDKRLTMLMLRAGHKTWMQQNARVWSTFPTGMRTFFRQRLRWARNTWRSDLRSLREGWVFRHKWLAFSMLDKAVSSFTLLVAPVFMIAALITSHFAIAGFLVLWWLVSRGVKYLPHFQRQPLDIVLLPVFIVVTFIVAGLKIIALLSIRRQRWLTRDVAVVDGAVVRVGDGDQRWTAHSARRRWVPDTRWVRPAALGLTVLGVASIGIMAVGVSAGVGRDPQRLETVPGDPLAEAALQVAGTVAPGPRPAPTVAGAPTGAGAPRADGRTPCPEPDAATEASAGAAATEGKATGRATRAYAPFRLLETGCRFPDDTYRAIAVEVGGVRLHAGGRIVRTVARAAATPFTLDELATLINDASWLEESAPGVFEIKAALIQGEATSLSVTRPRVREVRLLDNPHVFIGGRRAEARFDGVRVSSWSRTDAGVDTDYRDGRPFVLYEDGSRLDIAGSVFDHLGSDRTSAYGVAWRTGGTTGTVTDSEFLANFFGVYAFEAVDLRFSDSTFSDNVFYGADPHDRSRRVTFTNNVFRNNGSHGVIVSQEVSDVEFLNNRSIGNGGNGFVVDAGSFDVRIENNQALNNAIDGIVVLRSPNNAIINNSVVGNRVGIRVSGAGSMGNRIQGNTIEKNTVGIELYGGATDVRVDGTVIRGSERIGVIADAPSSRLINVEVIGGRIGIDLRSPASVEGGAVTNVEVGVVVRSPEQVTLQRIDITASTIGVRVDRLSSVLLSDSTVIAPQPYKGSEQIVRGSNVEVRTLAPPGLRWFGVFGFAFLVLGLALEALRRVRSRGRVLGGNPPDIVHSNFA